MRTTPSFCKLWTLSVATKLYVEHDENTRPSRQHRAHQSPSVARVTMAVAHIPDRPPPIPLVPTIKGVLPRPLNDRRERRLPKNPLPRLNDAQIKKHEQAIDNPSNDFHQISRRSNPDIFSGAIRGLPMRSHHPKSRHHPLNG